MSYKYVVEENSYPNVQEGCTIFLFPYGVWVILLYNFQKYNIQSVLKIIED